MSTPNFPTAPSLQLQPAPKLTLVHCSCETMVGVVATTLDPIVPGFLGIFTLLEDGAHTTPHSWLKRLATLPLGERPLLVVCLEAPEQHIRVLWGAHFVNLSFNQPTPEDRRVLAFARDISLRLLLATVVVKPEWLTPEDGNVP